MGEYLKIMEAERRYPEKFAMLQELASRSKKNVPEALANEITKAGQTVTACMNFIEHAKDSKKVDGGDFAFQDRLMKIEDDRRSAGWRLAEALKEQNAFVADPRGAIKQYRDETHFIIDQARAAGAEMTVVSESKNLTKSDGEIAGWLASEKFKEVTSCQKALREISAEKMFLNSTALYVSEKFVQKLAISSDVRYQPILRRSAEALSKMEADLDRRLTALSRLRESKSNDALPVEGIQPVTAEQLKSLLKNGCNHTGPHVAGTGIRS